MGPEGVPQVAGPCKRPEQCLSLTFSKLGRFLCCPMLDCGCLEMAKVAHFGAAAVWNLAKGTTRHERKCAFGAITRLLVVEQESRAEQAGGFPALCAPNGVPVFCSVLRPLALFSLFLSFSLAPPPPAGADFLEVGVLQVASERLQNERNRRWAAV